MSVNQHIEQLTDQYLRGELSGKELQSFEQTINSDGVLRDHVNFQQELVKGISDYRKVQLKTRLDAINVGAGSFGGGVMTSGIVKIASTAVVATVIGFGGYYLLDNSAEAISDDQKLEISGNDVKSIHVIDEAPSVPIPVLKENLINGSVSDDRKTSALVLPLEETESKETNSFTVKKAIVAKTDIEEKEEYVPNVNVPPLNDVSDAKEFISQEISIPEVSGNDIIGEGDKKAIDIRTFNRKSEEIKYKYFDGKLFLYGDFKKEPYEILEINSRLSRQIYLFYSDKYYSVEVSDEIRTLSSIVDDKLIKELKIIRDNKVN